MVHIIVWLQATHISDHGMRNEIDNRVAASGNCTEMGNGNEIDRVALQMGNETIESRSVEIALGM